MKTSSTNTGNSQQIKLLPEMSEKLLSWQPSKRELIKAGEAQAEAVPQDLAIQYYVQISRFLEMGKAMKESLGTRVLPELGEDSESVLGAEVSWMNPQRYDFDDPVIDALEADLKARKDMAKSAARKHQTEFITSDGEAVPAAIRKEGKPFVKVKL